MRRILASFALLPVAALGCGEIKTVGGTDGGGGDDAAPVQADAGNPGDPLNGAWQWWIGDDPENPDATCDVTIAGGAFEVYCPSDPYEVAPQCMRTKNDTRIRGTWTAGFDGAFDEIERYEGTGCPEAGYPDVNVDIVTEGILLMEAQHAAVAAGGFLAVAGGRWDWAMWDVEDEANRIECGVSFEPASAADATAFRVECLQEPTSPIPDCTEVEAVVIEGTIDTAVMTSEGWSETRYQGAGCDPMYPDPVVEGDHAPMGATRQ
ncbi:MAG TPA: hypothetical protein VFU21_09395 [Kofleriaceae bacterium]|nr:hypothetical protein [Kofleriaceae bacterium]